MNKTIRIMALGLLAICAPGGWAQEASLADKVVKRYSDLTNIEVAGKLEMTLEENGKPRVHAAEFKSWFMPTGYLHQMDQQPMLAGNNDKAYVYYTDKNVFMAGDVAPGRGVYEKLPTAQKQILLEQNPSLALAMSKDPKATLAALLGDDIKTQGDTLTGVFKQDNLELEAAMEIDPKTSVVKRYEINLAKLMAKGGRTDLKNPKLVVTYGDAAIDAQKAFALFSPPGNARRVEATAQGPAVGKPATDFILSDLDGNKVALSKLKGKIVILDFWATWCGPCRAEMPELNRLYQTYKEKGLVILAINNQEEKDKVAKFMADNKLEFLALLDPDGKVADQYSVEGLPTTVLIDKKGVIRSTDTGFSGSLAELEKKVTELLKGE